MDSDPEKMSRREAGGRGGPILTVRDLRVAFPKAASWVEVVRGISFELARGEIFGIVGESGSGKSLTVLSLLRLAPESARLSGSAFLEGEGDLLRLQTERLRSVRGGRIGVVFQEPMTALNPLLSIGDQVAEAIRAHLRMGRKEARSEGIRLLDLIALPDAARRSGDLPHQLSGGQRQRVLLAIALAGRPDLILADEPTTSLDLTLQAQMLDLLLDLRDQHGLTVVLITHDLGVAAQVCDRIGVLFRGELVELGAAEQVFAHPSHPHTLELLRSVNYGLAVAR